MEELYSGRQGFKGALNVSLIRFQGPTFNKSFINYLKSYFQPTILPAYSMPFSVSITARHFSKSEQQFRYKRSSIVLLKPSSKNLSNYFGAFLSKCTKRLAGRGAYRFPVQTVTSLRYHVVTNSVNHFVSSVGDD